jgi:hypothetical protein
MATDKKSFLLYSDQRDLFNKLPDDIAGKLIKLVYDYVNDLDPNPDDLLLQIAFEPIKAQLKRDLKDWELIKTKRSESGREGGIKSGEARRSKRKQDEANGSTASKNEANEAVNVNVTVNDNVTVNVKKRKEAFAHTLTPFKEKYGSIMLKAFYDYWTEPNKSKTKLRFEGQAFWDLSKRLNTWNSREKKDFIKTQTPSKNLGELGL